VQKQACLAIYGWTDDGYGVQVDWIHSPLLTDQRGLSCNNTVYIDGLYDEQEQMMEQLN